VAHARWKTRPGNAWSLDEFCRAEFSAHRQAIYGRSGEKIDTTALTVGQTTERLAAALKRLLC
jgi:hypothetical protein